MPRFKTFQIPDDYDEETTQWVMVLMCVPNTQKWRGVVSGAIYNLTRGRNWDEDTGIITAAQDIGRRIWESMTMDCNNDLGRIADALESLDAKYAGMLTWQEVLDDLEETLGTTSFIYSILKWFMDLFPTIALKADGTQLLLALWRYMTWSKPVMEMGQSIVRGMWALVVAVGGGGLINTTLTGWQTLALWFLDYLKGDTDIKDVIEDIPLSGIPDSEGGTGGENPDQDPEIRIATRIFVEDQAMSVNNVQTVTVNCGGGLPGCPGTQLGEGFIPDETPTGSAIDTPEYNLPSLAYTPAGFPSDVQYSEYRCKASNSLFLKFVESLYKIAEIDNTDLQEPTISTTIASVIAYLRADGGGLFEWIGEKSEGMLTAVTGWIGDPLGIVKFGGDPTTGFDVLNTLRLDLITNRQDVICAFYSGLSSGEIRTEVLAIVSDLMDGHSATQAEKDFAGNIVSSMLCNTFLGDLFAYNETIDDYSDPAAINCAVCSDYLFPTGTCVCSAGAGYAPEEGDGESDGTPTNPMPEDERWECIFTTPITITAEMTLEVYSHMASGNYITFVTQARIDGQWVTLNTDQNQSVWKWRGGSLANYVGSTLQGCAVDTWEMFAQSPTFEVDGVRVGGWQA